MSTTVLFFVAAFFFVVPVCPQFFLANYINRAVQSSLSRSLPGYLSNTGGGSSSPNSIVGVAGPGVAIGSVGGITGIAGGGSPGGGAYGGFLSGGIQNFVDRQLQQAFQGVNNRLVNNSQFPFGGVDYGGYQPDVYQTLPPQPFTQTPPPPLPPQPTTITTTQPNCGHSRFASPFIIGGEEAARGEWPWFASLFVSEGSDARRLKLLCGATLVSTKHVVTAAHCIELPNEPHRYTLMLGRHNIAESARETGFQSLKVTRLVIHPEYAARTFSADADIAIMKLQRAVVLNDRVHSVCLPRAAADEASGIQGTVVGYGRSDRINEHTNVPRKISVSTVDLVTCLYNDHAFAKIASERNFCAAGRGKSPCKGDSGGGFYVRDSGSGKWILYGIVSEGIITNGFCDVNKFVVFVDVSKFLPWIFQTLQDLATDPCDPFPCGRNADCFAFGDGHFCSCKKGFKGNAEKECKK